MALKNEPIFAIDPDERLSFDHWGFKPHVRVTVTERDLAAEQSGRDVFGDSVYKFIPWDNLDEKGKAAITDELAHRLFRVHRENSEAYEQAAASSRRADKWYRRARKAEKRIAELEKK